MKSRRLTNKKVYIYIGAFFIILTIGFLKLSCSVPAQLTLLEGQEQIYKRLFLVTVNVDNNKVVNVNNSDDNCDNSRISLFNDIAVEPMKKGATNLKVKIFGVIPIKTLHVSVVPDRNMVVCGNTVGVRMNTDGILVIGVSEIENINGEKVFPAKESGIKPGDLIYEVDNKKVSTIGDLVSQLNESKGRTLDLKFKRNSQITYSKLTPIKSREDSQYHVGMWVRDSTSGIGTLTFYDPDTRQFGALGHGIADIDTGILMPVADGQIVESSILNVRKGVQGVPGELKGLFIDSENSIGIINKNCEDGVYGVLNEASLGKVQNKRYSIALKNQIKEGEASILTNIDGKKVDEYSVIIQKVCRIGIGNSRGMVIKITDERLLNATGGIVQGMSGSPIIQKDKIVGAVTHVLINDPTKGYGVFIESMLNNIEER